MRLIRYKPKFEERTSRQKANVLIDEFDPKNSIPGIIKKEVNNMPRSHIYEGIPGTTEIKVYPISLRTNYNNKELNFSLMDEIGLFNVQNSKFQSWDTGNYMDNFGSGYYSVDEITSVLDMIDINIPEFEN